VRRVEGRFGIRSDSSGARCLDGAAAHSRTAGCSLGSGARRGNWRQLMRHTSLRFAFPVLFAGLILIGRSASAPAAEWGNVKGQVVWTGAADFKPAEVKVDKDQGHCLSKGPLLEQKYVVNPKNKGVRWVMVWLVDPESPTKKLPIHPTLTNAKGTKVVID